MAYEKQTWVTGEVVTSQKMNHIEAGIEAAAQSGGGGLANAFNFSGLIDESDGSISGSGIDEMLEDIPEVIYMDEDGDKIYMYLVSESSDGVGYGSPIDLIGLGIMWMISIGKHQRIMIGHYSMSSQESDGQIFVYDSSSNKYVYQSSGSSSGGEQA